MQQESHSWTRKELSQLGKMPDTVFAAQTGIPVNLVRKHRVSLEIPSFASSVSGWNWTKNELTLLGKMSDANLALLLGTTRAVVTLRRNRLGIPAHGTRTPPRKWAAKEIALLGTQTDVSLTKRLGISLSVVRRKRMDLGIPIYSPNQSARPWKRRDSWSAPELAMLGTMTDCDVAKKLGLNTTTVFLKRSELGIPRKDRSKPKRKK
jgi:hypothetical protein